MSTLTFPILWKDAHERGIKGVIELSMSDLPLKGARVRDLFPVLNTKINAKFPLERNSREVETFLLYGTQFETRKALHLMSRVLSSQAKSSNFGVVSEASQALQAVVQFDKPFFIVCFNHTITAVVLPLDRYAGLDVLGVLKRHSEIPFDKLCRISACLSVFYLLADYFWYAALTNVSVAAGTAIFNCSPLFVYCFSVCFLHKRPSFCKICGVLTSFVGVTMVVMFQEGRDAEAIANTSLVAGLLVVISAALYGGYEVALRLSREVITDTSTLLTMTGLTGLFTVLLWIVGSFVLAYSPYSPLQEPMGFPVTVSGVLLLLLSGIMAVVFNVLLPLSLCWTSPLETSVGVMMTIPLSGVIDALLHHTTFSWQCVVGSALVMGGFGILEYCNGPSEVQDNLMELM
ncbi:EamA-like transporter family [Phytophthora infestans]|uniref:EamA-like transporter family n=1 Tax=Phytophthora infestans TaxID=4787 RepID=A0A8S9TUR0_PHYIN|nr:EamA-like transporter family [Phytophthora infestans]